MNETANLRAALVQAISVLENYGDHHEWCARSDGSVERCNCGLWAELERLRAALAATGHWVDLTSPETVEALAEALIEVHGDPSDFSWRPAAILVAMRETGR